MFVDEVTHISNLLFKHTIGGRVCDHDGCQVLLVLVHLVPGMREKKVTEAPKASQEFISKTQLKSEWFTDGKQAYQQIVKVIFSQQKTAKFFPVDVPMEKE